MDNVATARRVFDELFNDRRVEAADELFAPGFRNHAGGDRSGVEGMKALIGELSAAFGDHRTDVDAVCAQDDLVAMRVTFSGTHTGDFRGMPASGRPFRQMQMHFVRFGGDGRIVDHWAVRDDLGMMSQLGLIPARA